VYVLELAGMNDAFAAYEAGMGASDVTVRAPGLAVARGLDGFDGLAFSHRASELLGWADPTVTDAKTVLQATGLDREGTAAVRAVDVRGTTGIDTQAVERELGNVLVDRGFDIDLEDPDHELRALFSAGEETAVCALGWLTAQSVRDFGERAPSDRPFFQPGSMDPMLARALANIAGAGPGQTILDPMCGTGGILIEAGLVGSDVVGLDAQSKMLRGSAKNFEALIDEDWHLARGDASTLPLADNAVDGVVFDTPYGRQSKIAGELEELVESALAEARRVAPRCVVVGDRSWDDHAQRAGWTIDATFERRVHKSLTRYILVLEDM
jgi:tRNA (guanine10-N2)-dimethyltransferase